MPWLLAICSSASTIRPTFYLQLCQHYTTYFCTEAQPDKYAAPCFENPLSQRWQRVAIQQAAGIAQS